MATKTITQLPSAGGLQGHEIFETVQLSGGFLVSTKTQARDINQSPTRYVQFDQGNYPEQIHAEGLLQWDKVNHTLKMFNEQSDMAVQLGQETVVRVYNNTGLTITNGSACYFSGVNSEYNMPTIALAKADSSLTLVSPSVATHDIPNNTVGYVTKRGTVRDFDTSGYIAGLPLYVSPVSAGKFTNVKPISPDRIAIIGLTTISHASSGAIWIEPAQREDAMKIISFTLPLTGVTDTQIPLTGTMSTVSTSAIGDVASDWGAHGHHVFIRVNALTNNGDIVITGDSVDETTGAISTGDTETITVYTSASRPAVSQSQHYQTNKKWYAITNIDVSSGTIAGIDYNYGYIGYPDMGNRNFRFIGYRLEAYSDGVAPDMRFIWTKIDGAHGRKKLFLHTIEDIGVDSDSAGDQIIDHLRTGGDDRSYNSPLTNIWGNGELFVFKQLDLEAYHSANPEACGCQANDINAKNTDSGYIIRIEGEPAGGGISNVQYIVLKLFYELG